jgi:type IV secretion system protein VirD4
MAYLLLGRSKSAARAIGFTAGRVETPRAQSIRDCSDRPLLTIAPTGAGKGVSALIPAALTWPGSLVVVDVKGELLAVTARARLAMGQRVAALLPFGLPWPMPEGIERAGLNPLDMIDPQSDDASSQAQALASALVPRGRLPDDPFWCDRAASIVAGLALWLRRYAPDEAQTLGQLRSIICRSHSDIKVVTGAMRNADQAEQERVPACRMIGDTARSIEQLAEAERTYSSVMQTADHGLAPLATAALQPSLITTPGLLEALVAGEAVSLYLVMPPNRLASHAALPRLWLSLLMQRLTEREVRPDNPTLVLVDEAAQIGRVDALLTAYSLLRGYGVKPWMFFQSEAQMQSIYGTDATVLMENAGVMQMFGPMTPPLAQAISRTAGDAIDPWTLGPDDQALCIAGQRPLVATRIDYRRCAALSRLASPNPFFAQAGRMTSARERLAHG